MNSSDESRSESSVNMSYTANGNNNSNANGESHRTTQIINNTKDNNSISGVDVNSNRGNGFHV